MMTDEGENTARREAIMSMLERLEIDELTPHLGEALTHSSLNNESDVVVVSNQRLEFLGDAVLSLCVSEMLMAHFTRVDEGELTLMRAALVNTRALAEAARELELGALLRMGRGAEAGGTRVRESVLADVTEAVLGAIFVDKGLDAARRATEVIVGPRFEVLVANGGIERDPKSRLQEWVQAHGSQIPAYEVLHESGPAHDKRFTVSVAASLEPSTVVSAQGQGRSKKEAERAAARAALHQLEASGGVEEDEASP